MEDIHIEILSRLPVKALLRFKCVSKFWNSLISQPYFKKKHLNHAKNQVACQKMLHLRWNPDCHFWSSTLPLDEVFKDIQLSDCDRIIGVKIFCSCDGLFLIGIWFEPYVVQPSLLVIWNPSTKESIAIPHSKCPLQMDGDDDGDDDGYYDGPNDVADGYYDGPNDVAGSAYGFAYDSTNDDYKIFRIDMYAGYEILSLKNSCWRIIDETSAIETANWMLSGWECLAFVHGAFHWIGILSRKICIVSFNISDDVFGEIQLPEIVCSQIHFESVVDVDVGVSMLGGMLGVYYKNDKAFDLWLMKNYKDSWMKLFTISSIEVYSIIPKYMFSNYKVLLCFCFDGETKRYVYRTISGGPSDRFWPLDYVDDGAATIEWNDFVYTESLISPKFMGH